MAPVPVSSRLPTHCQRAPLVPCVSRPHRQWRPCSLPAASLGSGHLLEDGKGLAPLLLLRLLEGDLLVSVLAQPAASRRRPSALCRASVGARRRRIGPQIDQ